MKKIDKSQFISTYIQDSEEYLTTLNQGLVKLEKEPNNKELLAELFRIAHTLKGSSRMMGFTKIADVSHKIEDIFGAIQEGKLKFETKVLDPIFKALDLIKSGLDSIASGKDENIEVEDICKELSEIIGTDNSPTDHRLSSTERENSEVGQAEEYLRIPITRVNKLLNLIGEIVINKARSSYKVRLFKNLANKTKKIEKMLFDLEALIKETMDIPDELLHHKGTIVRASQEMEKASRLLNQLHSTESYFGSFKEDVLKMTDEIQTETFHLDPVVEELQQKMKEIRMLPCSTVFEGFPRLVRDIAKEYSKNVELEIIGEETELDKKVLEEIKSPLIHLLRNAVDHGIEEEAKRKELGKDKTGQITLSAYQEGGNVIIKVSDDGKGINIEKIKETALRKSIVSEEELKEMSEKEIINLIYVEGFSTSTMITDVSGRGLGLDIARRDIERLKGKIEVESEKGVGTTFRIELPLTIAIMQVLQVESGGLRWALPLTNLEENIKVSKESISTTQNRMIIQVREKSIPIVPLIDLLGIQVKEDTKEGKKTEEKELSVVIANSMGKKIGFLVDKIVSEEEVFIKNIGPHLGKVLGVSGATILPTGEVLVILDTRDLIEQSELADVATRPKAKKIALLKKKKVLIVEDSLTTRELEKAILENNGFLVETAIDGLDALNKLHEVLFDAVVADIQMPRMDGFELCKNIKKDKKLKSLPVIFVTALSKDEEKRKGMAVGGQAYITKSEFDQKNLLDTLARLI